MLLYTGYGMGKQFTHHEVTTIDSAQESEKEVVDDTRHLVSTERMSDYNWYIFFCECSNDPTQARDI